MPSARAERTAASASTAWHAVHVCDGARRCPGHEDQDNSRRMPVRFHVVLPQDQDGEPQPYRPPAVGALDAIHPMCEPVLRPLPGCMSRHRAHGVIFTRRCFFEYRFNILFLVSVSSILLLVSISRYSLASICIKTGYLTRCRRNSPRPLILL